MGSVRATDVLPADRAPGRTRGGWRTVSPVPDRCFRRLDRIYSSWRYARRSISGGLYHPTTVKILATRRRRNHHPAEDRLFGRTFVISSRSRTPTNIRCSGRPLGTSPRVHEDSRRGRTGLARRHRPASRFVPSKTRICSPKPDAVLSYEYARSSRASCTTCCCSPLTEDRR